MNNIDTLEKFAISEIFNAREENKQLTDNILKLKEYNNKLIEEINNLKEEIKNIRNRLSMLLQGGIEQAFNQLQEVIRFKPIIVSKEIEELLIWFDKFLHENPEDRWFRKPFSNDVY